MYVSWHIGVREDGEQSYHLRSIAVNNCKQFVLCNSFLLMMFAASKCDVNIGCIMELCMLSARKVDNRSCFRVHPNVYDLENSMSAQRVFKCDCQNSLLIFPTIISHWLLAGWCFKLSCFVLLMIVNPKGVIYRGSSSPAISAFCQGV